MDAQNPAVAVGRWLSHFYAASSIPSGICPRTAAFWSSESLSWVAACLKISQNCWHRMVFLGTGLAMIEGSTETKGGGGFPSFLRLGTANPSSASPFCFCTSKAGTSSWTKTC